MYCKQSRQNTKRRKKVCRFFSKPLDNSTKKCYTIIVKRNGKEQEKIKKSSKKVLTNLQINAIIKTQ